MTNPAFNRHDRRQEAARTGVMPPPPAPVGTPLLQKQYFLPQGGFPFVQMVRRTVRPGEAGTVGAIEADGVVGANGQPMAQLTPDMFVDAEALADLIAERTVELQRQDESYLHLGLLLEALGELSVHSPQVDLSLRDGVLRVGDSQIATNIGVAGITPQVEDWRSAFSAFASFTEHPVAEEVAPA